MAISSVYLDVWAQHPSTEKAKNTYQKFKEIAESIYGSKIDIYLQGSYANDTNIKGESDVDIVLCFNDIVVDRNLYGYSFYQPYYSLRVNELRDEVYNQMNHKFNFSLTKGSKTIKYSGNQNYLPVDLVPCGRYSGISLGDNGIAIYDHDDGRTYINYPKLHIKNSEHKNGNCSGNYKKTVRMFKNAKEQLLARNLLMYSSTAPSYFVECLLYNVPDRLFVNNNYDTFKNILTWLDQNKYRLSDMKCPNGKHFLFEEGFVSFNNQYVYKRWNTNDARKFIDALVNLWQSWGK